MLQVQACTGAELREWARQFTAQLLCSRRDMSETHVKNTAGQRLALRSDALQRSLRDRHPALIVVVDLLEEVCHGISSLRSVIGVDVEAALAIHYDLGRAASVGGKDGQAARHGLYDCQPKRLVQSWLHEGALPICSAPISACTYAAES